MIEQFLAKTRKLIPQKLFAAFQPAYHKSLAYLAAFIYRFPSRQIKVVGITGTKGKTTTAELVSAILEEAGYKTALSGTLRFKIGNRSEPNLHKMTMPGRFFVQKFLRSAVREKCDFAVLEMTSEGAKQFRHLFIDLDALIFTNLAAEHIESHGSYEKYLAAKLTLAKALESSPKKSKVIVVNADDKEGDKFLAIDGPKKFPFRLDDAKLFSLKPNGLEMMFNGEKISSKLQGVFNVYNILAAATFGKSLDISAETIKKAVEKVTEIKGRVQKIDEGQNFTLVVDYAHTQGSLRALYEAFPGQQKICVLGGTGGGRDRWKRPEMGRIAEEFCDTIILTNEDPYDENPSFIIEEIAAGIKNKKPEIILDRREAIRKAIITANSLTSSPATEGIDETKSNESTKAVVLVTGKGTDPYIMEASGKKTPWSDERVAREEIRDAKNRRLT